MQLAERWLIQDDFLLASLDGQFDVVVGNPPYVRQELIPTPLLNEYRTLYTTMYDRSDLYVPFFERSLQLLSTGGTLGFICADRWMKNRYGGPLRRLIADSFHLRVYVDMVGVQAFQSEVATYPAITVIAREPSGPTYIAHRPHTDEKTLSSLASVLRSYPLDKPLLDGSEVRQVAQVANGSEPWLLDAPDQLALIRRLDHSFPSLELAGCKVGIGVATGADKIFISIGLC